MSKFNGMSVTDLRFFLHDAEYSPTECDGCSRLVAHQLALMTVDNQLWTGIVEVIKPNGMMTVSPHFWVELKADDETPHIIDFRLQYWAQLYNWPNNVIKDLPHGIFEANAIQLSGITYIKVREMPSQVIPTAVYDVLTQRIDMARLQTDRKNQNKGTY